MLNLVERHGSSDVGLEPARLENAGPVGVAIRFVDLLGQNDGSKQPVLCKDAQAISEWMEASFVWVKFCLWFPRRGDLEVQLATECIDATITTIIINSCH